MRTFFTRAAGVAMLALILAGCATPRGRFQSKKDPGYEGKLGKVLIILHNETTADQLGRGFSKRFRARITELLTPAGVVVEFARMNEGALDESSEVMAAAERFRPTHVLHLGPSDVFTRNSSQKFGDNFVEFSSNITVTFFFKLMLVQEGTTVWRSDATFYTIPRPDAVADQMVNQLTKAGLL